MCPRTHRRSENRGKSGGRRLDVAPVLSIPQQGVMADSSKPLNHLAFEDLLNSAGNRVHSGTMRIDDFQIYSVQMIIIILFALHLRFDTLTGWSSVSFTTENETRPQLLMIQSWAI